MQKSIGLIVNPIAGMGGKAGLKGTDGAAILQRALALGAVPLANERAGVGLAALASAHAGVELHTFAAEMGEDAARAAGLRPHVVGHTRNDQSDAGDTVAAAQKMAGLGVGLILFAGGDGTARDIYQTVSQRLPMLGIPTGVKMHSGVFATGPASAGRLAGDYVRDGSNVELRDVEIMDIDEDAQRRNRLTARLFGYARAPYLRQRVQHAKTVAHGSSEAELDALAHEISGAMKSDVLYIVGPGSTAKRLLDHLGLEGTLLGVDAVMNRDLVARDASEAELLALLNGHPAEIVTGIIGGQGFVFGRGNQQISAEVIRLTGRGNITIMAGGDKLVALGTDRLLIDTGDAALDAELAGFVQVQTAPGQSMMLRLVPA